MNALEPKKLALLRILQILEKYSDYDHPLKQEDIARYLSRDYGIEIERKAIGRNVSLLKEAGIDIECTKQGSYLAFREFDDSELRLLIDGVLASKYITAAHSKQIIEKLCSLSSVYFRSHVKNVYSVDQWSKTDNSQLFLNISIIDEAIENDKQITFNYNRYGADKKLHKTAQHKVSPYQLVLHNQHYYLMAHSERWNNIGYYRLDRITEMAITQDAATQLRSIEGYENGINYREISSSMPYMFSDKIESVEFLAEKWAVDAVVDWFGTNARIVPLEGKYKVTINVSPMAMEYWAMQYLNAVEIISPQSLRDKIKENLANAVKKYT